MLAPDASGGAGANAARGGSGGCRPLSRYARVDLNLACRIAGSRGNQGAHGRRQMHEAWRDSQQTRVVWDAVTSAVALERSGVWRSGVVWRGLERLRARIKAQRACGDSLYRTRNGSHKVAHVRLSRFRLRSPKGIGIALAVGSWQLAARKGWCW